MGTFLAPARVFVRPELRLSPWLADAFAGAGLVVFLAAAFFLAAAL
jgi:hypothetical protein